MEFEFIIIASSFAPEIFITLAKLETPKIDSKILIYKNKNLFPFNGYFLAEGMQFNVYNLDLNNVLKRPKCSKEIYKSLLEKHPSLNNASLQASAKYYKDTRAICTSFLSNKLINDKFAIISVSEDIVQQERITPIVHALRNSANPELEVEGICKEIVEMNFELWKYGVFEISFGIEKYGINNNGKIILYDPFEMSTDINDLGFLVLNKWWIQCNKGLPIELQKIVDRVFSKYFNVKNIYNRFKQNDLNLCTPPNLIKPIKSYIKTVKNKKRI